MKTIYQLYRKAILQSHFLVDTLQQLESKARDAGIVKGAQNIASILVDAQDVRDALKENPIP